MGCMRRNIIAVKTRPGEVRFVAVASDLSPELTPSYR